MFLHAFHREGKGPQEHTRESQTRLATQWLQSGRSWSELEALALSVRQIAQLEPMSDGPISTQQKQAWTSLLSERSLPPTLKSVLEAATPKLIARADLHALYGVLSGTMDMLVTLNSVFALGDKS